MLRALVSAPLALAVFVSLGLGLGLGCDKNGDSDTSEGVTSNPPPADVPADMAAELSWYSTCGDPVCSGYSGPWDGVPACADIQEGQACEVADETCDFMSDCNARLLCADADPKQQVGGCPISRRAFKTDIAYLDAPAREGLYRELLDIELATYRYRDRSDPETQLGIILEDHPDALWTDATHDRVEPYGLASLAVAGVQVQATQLEAQHGELEGLKAELAAMRAELEAVRAQAAACTPRD